MHKQNLNIQTYRPLRLEVIDKYNLSNLSKKNFLIPLIDIIFNYLQILLSLILVYISDNKVFVSVLAIIFIGTAQYSLMVIAHDGLHRNFVSKIKTNDLLNDLLILGMFGSACRVNRNNHSQHHKFSSSLNDPDRYKYVNKDKDSLIKFNIFLSGFSSFFRTLKNVFLNKEFKQKNEINTKLNLKELSIILFWQFSLIILLSKFFGYFGYFLYWFLPIYLFAYRGDLNRVFCEHNELNDDENINDTNYRLITFDNPNLLERLLFCPNNMNYHAEHHLFPQIPYYNLKKAHDIIRQNGKYKDKLKLRSSYFGHLIKYYQKLNAKN
jgi:fatty acid desaturase